MSACSQTSGSHTGITIIGIDCATRPEKTGLALGEIDDDGRLSMREVERGNRHRTPVIVLREWLNDRSDHSTLLALDAPLGWPAAMGTTLQRHQAGDSIDVSPDCMFKRITDRCVKKDGKNPLEVGADRIARTAHSALNLLTCLREATNEEIPLKWCLNPWTGIQAIEVYPALTLRALGIEGNGYKKNGTTCASIVEKLRTRIEFSSDQGNRMKKSDDIIDAVVCVQAGFDFLCGRCLNPPENKMNSIRREGWIWFQKANSDGRA